MTKIILNTIAITVLSYSVAAQDINFEALSATPKDTTVAFPLDYKIARPRLAFPDWDEDYDLYYKFLTPAIRKTQMSFSYSDKDVNTLVVPNAIIVHAQLDTATMLTDNKNIVGTWRMVKFRSMRFNDSISIPTKTYYRLPDVLLHDKSSDEAFAVISDDQFKLYAKEEGKKKFKKMMSAKYKIENNRYILVYKLAKAGGAVSQIGIDDKGYLILNYPKLIENVKKGAYFSYYAIIEQYIFQKVQ